MGSSEVEQVKVPASARNTFEGLKSIIELLDSYRIYRFLDPARVDRAIGAGKVDRRTASEWSKLKPELVEMTKSLQTIPNLSTMISVYSVVRTAGPMFLPFIILMFFLGEYDPSIAAIISTALVIALFAFIFFAKILQYSIAKRIEKHVKTHGDKFAATRRRLAQATQSVMRILTSLLEKSDHDGLEHSKYRLRLYNADYDGIKIIGKPSLLRKHYSVALEPRSSAAKG
jgi:hypothetical protein